MEEVECLVGGGVAVGQERPRDVVGVFNTHDRRVLVVLLDEDQTQVPGHVSRDVRDIGQALAVGQRHLDRRPLGVGAGQDRREATHRTARADSVALANSSDNT